MAVIIMLFWTRFCSSNKSIPRSGDIAMAAVPKSSITEEVLRQALPPEEEHSFKLIFHW